MQRWGCGNALFQGLPGEACGGVEACATGISSLWLTHETPIARRSVVKLQGVRSMARGLASVHHGTPDRFAH